MSLSKLSIKCFMPGTYDALGNKRFMGPDAVLGEPVPLRLAGPARLDLDPRPSPQPAGLDRLESGPECSMTKLPSEVQPVSSKAVSTSEMHSCSHASRSMLGTSAREASTPKSLHQPTTELQYACNLSLAAPTSSFIWCRTLCVLCATLVQPLPTIDGGRTRPTSIRPCNWQSQQQGQCHHPQCWQQPSTTHLHTLYPPQQATNHGHLAG